MNPDNTVRIIISGGQTGVDRAALDFALDRGLRIGGYVPRGREAEDGRIPVRYQGLKETESPDPATRTRLNVLAADATLIISRGALAGGSALTSLVAKSNRRPFLHIDLEKRTVDSAAREVNDWLRSNRVSKLNVAGPRASEDEEIYTLTLQLLQEVFGR